MKLASQELLEDALKMHADAVSAFAFSAMEVPADKWSTASNQKKWTAAQVTEHLTLVYEVFLRELGGGAGMKIVTNFLVKALARWFFLRKILNTGIFPKGARAPKETRPIRVRADQQTAIVTFEELARAFQETVQQAYNKDPGTKLTHAYFGTFALDSAVLLCTQHIRHHSKNLKS